MKEVIILGATGSIGIQTLELIKAYQEDFKLKAFSYGNNLKKALEIIEEFKPELVCAKNASDLEVIKNKYPKLKTCSGMEGLTQVSTYEPENKDLLLVVSVVGSVGLLPTYKALSLGRDILLANKETLVCAGDLVMAKARETGATIYPIDSEHSAILQCLQGEEAKSIKKLIITASGGSFRDLSRDDLKHVTKEMALKHPNWNMGAKITIDSATMMNKGFEIIEAHHLFNVSYDKIMPILHKESIVHSMVEFSDSTIKAQLGSSDMKMPILYALNKNKRANYQNELNLMGLNLSFQELSFKRFPCLSYAYEAISKGNIYPTVLNAANEAAVLLFLNDKIPFLKIEEIIKEELDKMKPLKDFTIENILKVDCEIKEAVLKKYGGF